MQAYTFESSYGYFLLATRSHCGHFSVLFQRTGLAVSYFLLVFTDSYSFVNISVTD